MRNVLIITIGLLCNSLIAQLKIDSTIYSWHYDLITETSPYAIYTCSNNLIGTSHPSLMRYDQNLSVMDTILGTDVGRPGARFFAPFSFNHKNYVYCMNGANPATREFSIHSIKQGNILDSIPLDLDTINDAYPSYTQQVDNNTLRVVLSKSGPGIIDARIIDLDSNFNLKNYHNIDLSMIAPYGQHITSVYEVSDSLWHVYTKSGLASYNPLTKITLDGDANKAEVYTHYKLSSSEYLAFGLSSVLGSPSSSGSANSSLGFYKVNSNAVFVDTVAFNAFSQPLGPNYTEYSDESLQNNKNAIIYSPDNVVLACQGGFLAKNTNTRFRYFHVVKTNFSGDLKWRWIWGNYDGSDGTPKFVTFNTIAPTLDSRCVITGRIRGKGLLIKLGPDGNISNVELDAPETVVSFYPNPVKDKLHYSFLAESNNTYTLEIIDMQGKPVLKKKLDNDNGFIPVNLKTGFYLYHLKDANGKVQQIGKIVAE